MKTLQRDASQPAKAKMVKKPAVPKMKGAAPAPAPEGFTAREFDAAEQLLHLSESSASSAAPRTFYSVVSGSSSSRSVNAPPAPAPPPGGSSLPLRPFAGPTDYEEEDEQDIAVAGKRRRRRRYRLIAEIYEATAKIRACSQKNKEE